jgi:hypothetical protein
MVLSYNSISNASSAASNDFTINIGSSGYTKVNLSTSFPAGSYICTSSLSDSSLDIYLLADDGSSAGFANATTSTTTVIASKSFDTVVVYGATNNDTLEFQFKYVFSPSENSSSDFVAVGPKVTGISISSLPNVDDTTVISGFNFASDVEVTFTGNGYSSTPAKNIVRTSSTSLTVTRPDNFPPSASPYTITVVNPGVTSPSSSNLNVLSNAVTAGNSPTWVTSSTLPNFIKTVGYSQQVLATDSDGGSSVTYSIVSGSLPSGITFNTANSTFSGTPTTNSTTPYSYTIRATDSGGNYLDRTFTLTQAIPDAPVIGTGTDVGTNRAYNNGAVSVTFTAPSYVGTSAITSYTVTASTGQSNSGSSSPIVVSGIASNATPTFTVTATNGSGTSLASSASSAVTVTTVPNAPTVGTASVTNSTTVSLSFTAQNNGGKTITSYATTTSPSISVSTSGTSSPLTITGSYVGGQSYTFAIAAVNANGTSSYSSASNSIIPLNLPTLSGGSVTSDATYYYRTFDSNGTLNVSSSSISVDYVVVAGGGGGGSYSSFYAQPGECNNLLDRQWQGGGGGGGGIATGTVTIGSGNHAITVGGGGTGEVSGSGSSFAGFASAGGGGNSTTIGAGGTSGSPQNRPGGSASTSQSGSMTCNLGDGSPSYNYPTYQRGTGGGGGGAGSNGSGTTAGSGSTYYGVTYAAGGAGGTQNNPGATNRGIGGGGYNGASSLGAGGSGRVIIRYLKSASLG